MLKNSTVHAFVNLCIFCLQVYARYSFDHTQYKSSDIITTDVAIVGGVSAGVYSAIRLQDHNKSVVVIERNSYLGGHAETYVDPQSGVPINLGVIAFPQTQIVRDYFSRFQLGLTTLSLSYTLGMYVDFSTEKTVQFTGPATADVAAALQGYTVQLKKYLSVQAGFNLTYPVPSDLLLPYGHFLSKYNLSALIPTSFAVNQSYSPFLNISTLYMLKYLNINTLNSIAKGSLTPTSHDTAELYGKALAHFGSDALLNTKILAMDRSSPSDVEIVVQTGEPPARKLIIAKKLLSTPPPKIHDLAGYDLSQDEKRLFAQFHGNGYYVGVLNNTGLPVNRSYTALTPGNEPYELPELPGIYGIGPTGASILLQVFYGSPIPLPIRRVKADILTKVKRLAIAQGIDRRLAKPEFVAFTVHAPFNLMVSKEAIARGFYDKLYKLNGQRNTFYAGAAWQAQDSNSIWEYTESYMLPIMLDSLSRTSEGDDL